MTDLTKFRERSPLVLVEARAIINNPIGESISKNEIGTTEYYCTGSFYSKTLNKEVYAGKKLRPKDKKYCFDDFPNGYFISSLTNLILIDEYCPQLSSLMPEFFGCIVINNQFDGILMQDYTENRRKKVGTFRWPKKEHFPEGLLDKFSIDPDNGDALDEYGGIFANINGNLKIMDVNRIPWSNELRPKFKEISGFLLSNTNNLLEPYLIRI